MHMSGSSAATVENIPVEIDSRQQIIRHVGKKLKERQNFLQSKNNSGRLRLIWILWIHLMYRGGRQEAAESERRKTGKDFCILSGRKYSDVPQQQQWTADCRRSKWSQLCFLPVIDFFFQPKLSNLHPAPLSDLISAKATSKFQPLQ